MNPNHTQFTINYNKKIQPGLKFEIIGIIVLISLIILSCQSSDRNLSKSLEQQIITRPNENLVLSQVTDFEWNKLYIFPPYTDAKVINETLGYQWTNNQKMQIDESDSISLLVFTNQGKVIRYLEYPRSQGDFSALAKPQGYSPQEAIFRRQNSPQSNQINLELIP